MQQKIQDILALNVSQQYRKKAEQNKINLERLKKYLQRNEKKHQLLMKICELPIKTFYEKIYLAQNYENIFEKFEIAKNKKLKIQFFQELIQELKAKKEDDKYIEQLQTESIFFINDFINKNPKIRLNTKKSPKIQKFL